MKRLLAYLFIVFGLGLTFNVNAEVKILEVCSDGLSGYNQKLYIKLHSSKKSLNKQKTDLPGSQYYECESHTYSNNKDLYFVLYKSKDWHHRINQGYKWDGIIYGENYLVILRTYAIKFKSNIYPSEKKQTQTAKVEPSQTQKVAGKVDLVFCRYALKTSESFSNLYSGYANLKDNGCNKFVGISTGYIIQNITPRKDLEISYKEFIKLEKNIRKKFSGLCYSEKNQDILLKFPINVSTDCNEIKPGYVKLSYVEKGKFSYTSKETQIAKVEPTDKPKKTNKQSKTKITKKIIKNDAQDLKVKGISTWEKNVIAAIEKESSDPYCKLVDKKPKLNELKFKKNYCIKKSDILKLGKYKRFNTPQFLLTEMKNCKSKTCLADKAGKNVYKIFVQKTPIYHAKYPGDMIKGMVWFEILYQTKLKKLQKIIKRYEDQTYEGLWKLKKKNHESQIYSLIKLNNGRIKMRNALGFTVYNDLYEVIEGQWLLAEFLNKDKLEISKVKMTPEMFKRKELIEKYKTVLAKYKKKLDEEKNKKN